MSPLTIDVDAQIENLRGLKVDLEEYFWKVDPVADANVRYALGVAIAQLAQRIGALEEVIRHHGGEEVAVGELPLDETRAMEHALDVLDGEFVVEPTARGGRWWSRVRQILAAADELLLAAARGDCVRTAHHDRGPRPGVVLPLIRSSR